MSKDNRFSLTRKGRENCKLSFEWILNPYRSSLLATIIVHFCKYYHNQSSRKSLRFPKNRGKNWNVVFASYFLIQNMTTVKYDRFLTVY